MSAAATEFTKAAVQAAKAKLHIAKKELELTDDIYRDILREATGKESSAKMTLAMINRCLDRMAELGWKVKSKNQTRKPADDDMSRMIRGLWIELHEAGKVRDPSEKALGAYVLRMSRKSALQWCSVADKTVIIEALKKWLAREGK